MRYAEEVLRLKAEAADLGKIRSVMACGPMDFFGCGIHTAEMLQGFLGTGAKSVKFVDSSGDTSVFSIAYDKGPICLMQLAMPSSDFHINVCGEKGTACIAVESDPHPLLVQKFAEFVRTGEPPVPLSEAIESIRLLIAAKCADGHVDPVYLDDLHKCAGFDGWEYADQYAEARTSTVRLEKC